MIEIDDLLVKFGTKTALRVPQRITIKAGSVVGLIGENGAGKSTLLNAILGEVPYTGTIKRGFSWDQIGVQFQENSYNPLMTVGEIIRLVADRPTDSELSREIAKYELSDLLRARIGKLSGGERQRLTLFLVLAARSNSEEMYIFDELTTGLDFQKRQRMVELVRQKTRDKTVVITTHYFEELTGWADYLLILTQGNVVFFGTQEELARTYAHDSVIGVFSNLVLDDLPAPVRNSISGTVKNEGNALGLIARTIEHRSIIEDYFQRQAVSYNVQPKSLYSHYVLALQHRDSSCNA